MSDKKILLVEDESIEALDIKRTLEFFGYEVPYVATSSEEAVEKALAIMPDLILMDIILKGETDGIETVSKIKDLNIPVIYLTAHSEESTIERAKLTEPYGYIIKPYDRTELKYAIELAIYKNKLKNKLKDSETKYRTLFNQAADGILLMEGDKFIECNDRALEIYGTNREQLIGKTPYSVFSPEVQPNKEISEDMAIRYINKALDGYPQHFEWEHLKYDGKQIYTEISLNRLKIKGQYLLQAIVRDITDRKHAENELKKSHNKEQLQAEIIRDASVSIGIGYPDGKLGFVNKAFEKLTGYSEEELKTINWNVELTPEKWRLTEQKCLDELQHSKKSVQYEKEYIKKDGSIVPIELVVNPHLDSKGNVDHYFSFITNITERKEAEEALQDSENEYHDLFNHLNSGVAVYEAVNNGKDFIFKDFNTAAENIEHIRKEDVIGKKLTEAFPGVKDFGIFDVFQKVWKTGTPEYFPENIYKDEKDPGSWRENWVYKLPNGKIVAIYNNITERKKAEIKRLESEEFLENIVENIPNTIFIKSADKLNFEMVNKAAEDLFGHPREELIGTTDYDIFPKDQADFFTQKDREVLQNKKLLDILEENIETKNLGQRILHTKKIPIFNKEGNPQYLLGISEDITELKHTENALKESETNYRELVNNSLVGIYKTNLNGDILFINDAMVKMFHYEGIDDLKGNNIITLYNNPKDRLQFLHKLEEKYHLTDYKLETVDKNGQIVNVLVSAFFKDDVISGMFMDITELKRSEKALIESEGLLRGLFDNMPSGMSVYQVENDGSNGSDYIIKEFNLASQKIEGMKIEDVIGKSLKDIRPEIDEYGLIPIFKKVWETGKPIHYPEKIYVDEKFANYYENYVFKAPTGEIVAIYEDVTKQKNAKEALKKQTAEKVHANILLKAEIKEHRKKDKIIQDNVKRLNIALESADMGAWDLNLENDTSIRTLDHDKIFGYDTLLPEWGTKIFFEHILPEDREHVQQQFEKSYKTNKLYFKCRITRPDKEIRWIEAYGNVYRNEKGVPIRMLGVVSDITERIEAETHLLRTIDEKEMLLREIHHRVKNNMQIISSFLSLQSSQVFDNRDASLFTNVQDRVKSMALIHDNLYKSEDLSSIQFKEYVKTLISQLFATHSELSKNIKLVTDIFDVTFNMETAIPLGLIISEMVTNSLKHAFPDYKGEISISLHTKGEETELIIKDNGVGVPKDFDIKKPEKLGLQLLNTLVEQLEGTIKLDRSHGTEFKIIFKELEYKERI